MYGLAYCGGVIGAKASAVDSSMKIRRLLELFNGEERSRRFDRYFGLFSPTKAAIRTNINEIELEL